MSDGKKVKRWTLNWPQEISVTCIGGDAIQSGSTVVLASDHDRIVAEIKEGNYAFSEQIAKQRYTIAELRAEVERLNRRNHILEDNRNAKIMNEGHEMRAKFYEMEETIAAQAKVIEKVKKIAIKMDCTCGSEGHSDTSYRDGGCFQREILAAIEKERAKDEC